jgi:hypothetical protein
MSWWSMTADDEEQRLVAALGFGVAIGRFWLFHT